MARNDEIPPGHLGAAGDEALEELLRRTEPAAEGRPSAGFRGELKERFLADVARAPQEDGTSQLGTTIRSGAHVDQLIEGALRAHSPQPEAPSAFRQECRRRFLAVQPAQAASAEGGRAPGIAGDAEPVGGTAAELLDREPRSAGPTSRGRLVRFTAVLAGVAAACLVFLLPDRPRWRLEEITGRSQVLVAGKPMSTAQASRFGQELLRGAALQSRESTVDLALDDWLTVQVREGTELEFAEIGEFESDGILRLSLGTGEIFVSTRPEATPAQTTILIQTKDGLVEVTGTSLGVLSGEGFTCVCVARGQVMVHAGVSDPAASGSITPEMVEEETSFIFTGTPGAPTMRKPLEDPRSELHRNHSAPLVQYARDR